MDTSKRKRVRRDPDTTRKMILDAAERIMVEESYAAVSTRRVAQEIALNPATIHYYFPTTEDLFIALHKRMTEQQRSEIEAILTGGNPLQALWTFQSNWSQSALGVEFLALSNHRKGMGRTLSISTNEAREIQACALERALAEANIELEILSPAALATILMAIARTLANEERVGITHGHDEVRKFIQWVLADRLKPA